MWRFLNDSNPIRPLARLNTTAHRRAGFLFVSVKSTTLHDASQEAATIGTNRRLPPIWIPLFLLVAGSIAFRFSDLDLSITHWFWSAEGGWRFGDAWLVNALYAHGNYPALIVAMAGLLVCIASCFVHRLKPARCLGGFLALAMIFGPGLLINLMLKDHYGRPRPRQVTEFGGSQQFRPLGEPTFDGKGKSFPSGHASMGFFWFAPAIHFWPRSRRLAWGLAGLALAHGGLMGFGRMAQGGHWPSDILWSAGIVYISAWILHRAMDARMRSDTCSAVSLIAGLCVLGGCASPRNDASQVSADLERRSGHSLTNGRPGEVVLPATVSFDDGLSEDEAVAVALWNNAAFQETLADLGLSRADLVQAGMLPNPTLSMLFPVGAKPIELTAKYPIEALWLRPRRVAAAKLDHERTTQRLVQNGLDLIRDVRLACADLGLANQRLAFAETNLKLSRAVAEQAQARLRAGEASELEAANANIDSLQTEEQLGRAAHDANTARERLRALIGLGLDRRSIALVETPLPNALPFDSDVLVTKALEARPDLRAAELGLEAAGRRLGLAKAEICTFTVALNAKEVGADFLSGPGLDIPIPIFNQNQGGIAQARAKFEKAARQYLAARDRIVLEVREARTRLIQAQESHEQWQRNILPEIEESARLAEESHAAGNATFLFVLEASRKLSDARLKTATAGADVRRAHAELERSVGQRLETIPPSVNSILK